MTHDPALEAHAHAEHAEHATHENDPFNSQASITIAALAVLAARRAHEHRPHWLTAGATLLEIGIAICTVAIITRRRAFWLGSIGLGVGGLAIAAVAFLA